MTEFVDLDEGEHVAADHIVRVRVDTFVFAGTERYRVIVTLSTGENVSSKMFDSIKEAAERAANLVRAAQ